MHMYLLKIISWLNDTLNIMNIPMKPNDVIIINCYIIILNNLEL